MLEKFVEKILSLSDIKTYKVGNVEYSKEKIYRIKAPAQELPGVRQFETLTGLVEYTSQINDEKMFMRVGGPTLVTLFGGMDPANENIQFRYGQASLVQINFEFNKPHVLETFVIEILSLFDETPDSKQVFEVLANLKNKIVTESADDGFTQSLQIKTGLTTKSAVEIKIPVNLKPFRTFREVSQPVKRSR